MSFLRLEHVSKYFGEFQALKDISFEAEAGAFVVLLGPSGCGKSTLLRLITGLTEDHEGEIYIGGRRVTDLDPKDRKVAMVFQSYALYPHLTVRRNISFGMEINRFPRAERDRRVGEAARALQLEPLLDRLPAQLSGGQRQRVAIGRCLVREPDLFLFDEPLSNLDAKLRHDTRVELKHLHQRLQATTVYVTHDQHEAMTLATMVVLLKDGEIVQIGSPGELYAQPVNRFAATFIGSPAINLIKGDLTAAARFTGGGLDVQLPATPAATAPGGRAIELGLRSESARLATDAEAQQVIDVDYVELAGADLYVNGHAGGQEVVVRLERTARVAAGDRLPVRWQLDQALIFDAATGKRLG
ncbi:MAG TPA: sn-glycerol-3-phosphate ABC transporter ATP-binding protein UgpC [Devosia sp.]|nr:sn-glycerol-3-phosphate ABC transporter ATP-binding protein UgpC [Devosia sp.]